MSASRSHTIDALRGMAAISVALFHFNEGRVRDGSFYDNANRWGWLGVPVFFCFERLLHATSREP
jgi:peptidoglycan/LPS O-acetylase OafA/YrhL